MVGTPKSTGCATCRKRKKKCGEQHPQCLACVSAGWKCPGYSKRWKFVDESPQLSSLYKNKKYIFEEVDHTSTTLEGFQNGWELGSGFSEKYTARCGKLQVGFRSLTSENDRSGMIMAYILEDKRSQAKFPLVSHGTFYSFIPSRLGRNPALDITISCLCGIYVDTLTNNSTTSEIAIRRYAKSLNSLRICVEDPELRCESETICATIILQLCELLMSADNGRWNHLSSGTKVLIQDCEPSRYVAPFERAMLESQRAFVIVQDMNAGQKCFLSQPQWRKLLEYPAISPVTQGPPSLFLRAKLCDFLVHLPDLFHEAFALPEPDWSGSLHQTYPGSQHEHLLRRAIAMTRGFESWYTDELEHVLVACASPPGSSLNENNLSRDRRSDTATGFEYPELLLAVLDCVSNSILIKLDSLLLKLASMAPQRGVALEFTMCSATMLRRQAAVQGSFDFVKRKSGVAAKPLQFGLQQIWSNYQQC